MLHRERAAPTLWLTAPFFQHTKHCRNLCPAPNMPRKKTNPGILPLLRCCTQTQHRPMGESSPGPVSVRCGSLCCVKASGRAVFSAITAGQSSAVSWVSIGHGSTVHYHMGVATGSLHGKCFQLRSKRKHVMCLASLHRTAASLRDTGTVNVRVIMKSVYHFIAESLGKRCVLLPWELTLTHACLIIFKPLLQCTVGKQWPLSLVKSHISPALVVYMKVGNKWAECIGKTL